MPKKLIIGISIAAVLVAAAVLAVLLVRSRALTGEEAPIGGGATTTDGTGSSGSGLGSSSGGPSSGQPGGSQGTPTVPQEGPCGDGICGAGEAWCKPDCGNAEERFQASITAMDVTPTSFKITWKTDVPSTGEVAYGKTEDYELGTVRSPSPAASHAVQLTGLSPGTNYLVRVRVTEEGGTTREAASLNFETPASR